MVEYKKCSTSVGHFLLSLGEQLNLPLRASEVILDSEVHFVSEVLPNGKVANFTSLVHSTNFTASQLYFRVSENFTASLKFPITSVIAMLKSPLNLVFTSLKKGGSTIC